jgi:hypothetical protein
MADELTDFDAQVKVGNIYVAKVMETNTGDILHVGPDLDSILGFWAIGTEGVRRLRDAVESHDTATGVVAEEYGIPLVYDGQDYWLGDPELHKHIAFKVNGASLHSIVKASESIEPQIDKRTR